MDAISTSDKIRSVRKRRGMTQRELARASGVSLPTIKAIEQGINGTMRLETARKLAVALKVSTTMLIAGSDREDADEITADEWKDVRRSLAGLGTEAAGDVTPDGVRQAVAAIRPAVTATRYGKVRPVLPALVRDANALDREDEDAREARFRALNMTAWVLIMMRQWDTAMDTLDQAHDAAPEPLDTAEVVKARVWLLLRQGELAAARDTATLWADRIEPRMSRATNRELSLWGALLLNIANAAIRDNRPGEAEDALRLARAAASAIGREVMSDVSTTRLFGPVSVAYNRAEMYAIDGQPDKTLAIDESVPDVMAAAEITRLRHRLDVANALAQMRHYPEAVTVIKETHASAPEWLPQQRYARDVLSVIVNRRRTLTPDMRDLADVLKLPL